MSPYGADLWLRAKDALKTARADLGVNADAAASRAYYAGFYAVSALFAQEGREFAKHTAVHAAVHRDLVKAGRWPSSLGEDYSFLLRLRETGDYGGAEHVTVDEAKDSLAGAERILDAVSRAHPELAATEGG
jgi:uncharacterized protein (UPF0332 family)